MSKKYIVLVVLLALVVNGFQVNSQDLASLQPNDTLPLDPLARVGKLKNGLTYYLRRNTQPENKVSVKFVVKAGFNQEDEGQDNVAHVVEHLPFTGTVNFANPREYFEAKGVKRNDINADTHHPYTSYQGCFTSNRELIHDFLRFLRDCAGGITFMPEKIKIAKRAVYAEISEGSHTTARQEYMTKIVANSEFKIPSAENIKVIKDESLSRFYRDWYRPNLQAIIIVGDIDMEQMEQEVISIFSDLRNPQNPRPLQKKNDWSNPASQILTFVNPNQVETEIRIIMRRRQAAIATVQDYYQKVIVQLFHEMMAKRFNDARHSNNVPFESASCNFEESYDFNGDAILTKAIIKSSEIKNSFQFLTTELERVRLYGFSKEELERSKKNVSPYTDRSTGTIIDDYEYHFVEGQSPPNIEFENKIMNRYILEATPEEVNRVTRSWISDINRDIVMFAPSGIKDLLPDEARVIKWQTEARTADIRPYQLLKQNKEITLDDGALGLAKSVTFDQHEIAGVDVTDIVLSNGLRILLRPVPSTDTDSTIYIHGFSKGGASVYDGNDCTSALLSNMLINHSGLGPLSQFELNEFRTENGISVNPYINESSEGIFASSKSSGLKAALYLVYQYFSSPGKDSIAFQNVIASAKADLLPPKSTSEILQKAVDEQLIKMNFKRPAADRDVLDKIRIDKMYDIYRQRFANAGDFTFLVTGNFDRRKVIPVLTKYLGSLSGSRRKEAASPRAIIENKDIVRKTVYGPLSHDQANVQLKIMGSFKMNKKNVLILELLKLTLQDLLMKRLRMKDGSVYAVHVIHNRYTLEKNIYSFSIIFRCAAENVERITSNAREEISSIATGLAPDVFAKVVTFERDQQVENMNSHEFWMTYLQEQVENDQNLADILDTEKLLSKLTPKDIQEAAKEYLDMRKVMQFVILPEARNPSTLK